MILEEPLTSDTLELKTLKPHNASQNYLNWLHDPEINRYLEIRFDPPSSVPQLAAYIASAQASPIELLLGMFLPSNSRHIGNIKIGPIDFRHNSAEIGLLIGDRAEWGKGHAPTAIKMLSEYAFSTLKLSKISAGAYAPNVGSVNAFRKVGYRQEGVRVDHWALDGGRCDGILLGCLPSDLRTFSKREAG